MDYFITEGGAQRGPFPAEQLPAQGVRPETMIWAQGMAQWERADAVPEVRALLPAGGAPAGSPPPPPPGQPVPMPTPGAPAYPPYNPTESKRVAAGICGILLGGLGIHKFILGLNTPGTIMLCCTLGSAVLSIFTCGVAGVVTVPLSIAIHIIGLVEGIIYLTKSDAEFYQTYIVQKKEWF